MTAAAIAANLDRVSAARTRAELAAAIIEHHRLVREAIEKTRGQK